MAYFQRCSGFSSTNTRPRGHPYPSASEEMSCLVDYIGKILNLLEDLEKLNRFAQSVEDELNRIVSAGEGSRKDP